MNIRVFERIDNPFLKSEWERLEVAVDIFPQSTYHWCATWWKHLSGQRKLHVVMALDEEGKALGIAPLCTERHFGIRVLRSFPIHFGDFYTFILDDEKSPTVNAAIIEYISSNKDWRWVRLEQVVEINPLAKTLEHYRFFRKKMTACVIVDIEGLDWDGYLSKLKTRFRRNIRSRLRNIHRDFNTELQIFDSWQDYEPIFEEMMRMHKTRWEGDHTPAKGSRERYCWKEAIKYVFEQHRMLYVQLVCNEAPVAYRLGFINDGMFFDWHTSFDPNYRKYHVGQVLMSFAIMHFIESGTSRINFMAGEYGWKLDWSPDRKAETNYMFSSPSSNLAAVFLNYYHHRMRDRLKNAYHKMMNYRIARTISRNAISLRRKLTPKQ